MRPVRRVGLACVVACLAACTGGGATESVSIVPGPPAVAVLTESALDDGATARFPAVSAIVDAGDLHTVRALPGFAGRRPVAARGATVHVAPLAFPHVLLVGDGATRAGEPGVATWRYDVHADRHDTDHWFARSAARALTDTTWFPPGGGTPLGLGATLARDGTTLVDGGWIGGRDGAPWVIAYDRATGRGRPVVRGQPLALTSRATRDANTIVALVLPPGRTEGAWPLRLHRIDAATWTVTDSLYLPPVASLSSFGTAVAMAGVGDVVVTLAADDPALRRAIRCRFVAPRGCEAPLPLGAVTRLAPLPDGSGWYDAACVPVRGAPCTWLRFRDASLRATDSVRLPPAFAAGTPARGHLVPPSQFVAHGDGALVTAIELTSVMQAAGSVSGWAPWRIERRTGVATRGAVRMGRVVAVLPCCGPPP